MEDRIDHRYLGALKCVDHATGFHLTRTMDVSAEDLSFIRNRSNLYVINKAAGLEQHVDAFASAPSSPSLDSLSFNVSVSDPLNQYLPRLIEINLPRDTDPANSDSASSIFNPIEVPLYAAPNANLMANWSTVRVALTRQVSGDDEPVAGALLRVIRNSDDQVLSSGLSDQRGEALVIVPGIPITQFADDEDDGGPGNSGGSGGPGGPGGPGGSGSSSPVVVSEISARLEVSVDTTSDWPANPDVLEVNHAANLVASESLTLSTGQMEKVTIQLT